jgi:hypothetical protein
MKIGGLFFKSLFQSSAKSSVAPLTFVKLDECEEKFDQTNREAHLGFHFTELYKRPNSLRTNYNPHSASFSLLAECWFTAELILDSSVFSAALC